MYEFALSFIAIIGRRCLLFEYNMGKPRNNKKGVAHKRALAEAEGLDESTTSCAGFAQEDAYGFLLFYQAMVWRNCCGDPEFSFTWSEIDWLNSGVRNSVGRCETLHEQNDEAEDRTDSVSCALVSQRKKNCRVKPAISHTHAKFKKDIAPRGLNYMWNTKEEGTNTNTNAGDGDDDGNRQVS